MRTRCSSIKTSPPATIEATGDRGRHRWPCGRCDRDSDLGHHLLHRQHHHSGNAHPHATDQCESAGTGGGERRRPAIYLRHLRLYWKPAQRDRRRWHEPAGPHLPQPDPHHQSGAPTIHSQLPGKSGYQSMDMQTSVSARNMSLTTVTNRPADLRREARPASEGFGER